MAVTKDYAFAIASVIIGVKKYLPDFDDIYVYHDGITESDKNALNKIHKIKFVTYRKEDFISKCSITNDELSNVSSFGRYTHMACARYEMFNLLNDYHHVFYFDFDMLIQADISDLYNYNFGMCKGVSTINYGLGMTVNDIDGEQKNFSSGIIVISDQGGNGSGIAKLTSECYKYTKLFLKTLRLPDQAIINYVLLKNNIKVDDLSDLYYGSVSQLKSVNAKIIHAYGKNNRFWNNQLVKICYPEFTSNYKKWLDLGGSKYKWEILYCDRIPKYHKGYLYQYFERVHIVSTIFNNLSLITRLPIYPICDFNSSIIKLYVHNIEKNKLYITLQQVKQNEIVVVFYINSIKLDLKKVNYKYVEPFYHLIYSISVKNLISDLKNCFDDFIYRVSILNNL